MFTSPASSSFAAFEIPKEKIQGKSGSDATALGPRAAWLWPPLVLGCAGSGMKVVLQRVTADLHGGKFAQGQHKIIPFSLTSAEIPD